MTRAGTAFVVALVGVGAMACAIDSRPASSTVDVPPARASARAAPEVGRREPTASVLPGRVRATWLATRDRRARSVGSRAQLAVRLGELEQLLLATPSSAPERAESLWELADGYELLARAATRDARAADDRDARTIIRASRARAIAIYEMLAADYPRHPQWCELTYDAALVEEQAGDGDGARRLYEDVIARGATSPVESLARFGLAELHLARAADDAASLGLAERAFQDVLHTPPPLNPIFAEALLRLGEIARRRGDDAAARALFERVRAELPSSEAAALLAHPAER